MTSSRIAILGWGSLLWDAHPEFDQHHDNWRLDGPSLRLEFSRISTTRERALTLVIDGVNGSACTVSYCMNTRRSVGEAIEDLMLREGTRTRSNIGIFNMGGDGQCRDINAADAIATWARSKSIAAVIWTDLPSNFESFSVAAALEHIQSLPQVGRDRALEYIRRAPTFVRTHFRSEIERQSWFLHLDEA